MAWKVKTPEEARECGLTLGSGDGSWLEQVVSDSVNAENFGDARRVQERFWDRIEKLKQTRMGRRAQVFTFEAKWDLTGKWEPRKVRVKGQENFDAFISAYEEAARSAFKE
jgi:hypothetical protein